MVSPSQSHQDAVATGSWAVTLVPLPVSSKPTTPMLPLSQSRITKPNTPRCAPPLHNPDVGGMVPHLNLAAASPRATTSSLNTSTLGQPTPSHQLQALLKQPTSSSVTSKMPIVQPPVNKTTESQQQTIQRKVKPTPITSGSANVTFSPDTTSPLHQKPGKTVNIGLSVQAARLEVPARFPLSKLLAVDAATHSSINPGPNPVPEGSVTPLLGVHEPLFLLGTDDEEEQVQGDLVEDERVGEEVTGTDGEDGDLQGQDYDEAQSNDKVSSPPPTKTACHLRNPWIEFVFDDLTGDFVKPYPTIFLSRPATPPSQSADLRHSAHSNTSPVNHNTTYLKTAQGSKSSAKRKKKDSKSKAKVPEVAIPRKHTRDDDEGSQAVDKPATKKLKSKDRQAIKDGIKSIGVLKVDKDFGNFVQVDGRYWSKDIALRHNSHCHKLLTHMVICVHCHYAKQPCKVDGKAALNPLTHYHPKDYDSINTFESILNAIDVNNEAILSITQQYLSGLNIQAHSESIRIQMLRLRECLDPVEKDEEDNDGKDDDDEAPDDVAEGESGPSKKRKHK
ncbi:hypothetical protein ARMGADRAFT_1083492 [Armillaria gallica]|uniref:Uncharacterized protein n=1 Tax=Armillaria gallica TaxID=47427 RepID=A0A2H3D2L8_ARMGA|nr:hypothetical protein ARMGADRAFT_1083492 [Armillaria gallica]